MSRVFATAPAADARLARRCGRFAVVSLYDELALEPKPGLVSFVDSGSHQDMNAQTFMRSLFALRGYFAEVSLAGMAGAEFATLERLGLAAEARMLAATGGVNTHRGAVFLLGLLCASVGKLIGDRQPIHLESIRSTILISWGEDLRGRIHGNSTSHGSKAARRFGLRGANEEAALAFPSLFEHAMPALRAARDAGLDDRRARLHVLFSTMALLDDTTLAHRGGIAGLIFAKEAACEFLGRGGAAAPDAVSFANSLHRQFVERRLSPGGSADILAAACFLERICEAR